MVWKVEAACKLVGAEFLGWEKSAAGEATVRFQRGEMLASLILPVNSLELMSVDTLAVRIGLLFNSSGAS